MSSTARLPPRQLKCPVIGSELPSKEKHRSDRRHMKGNISAISRKSTPWAATTSHLQMSNEAYLRPAAQRTEIIMADR